MNFKKPEISSGVWKMDRHNDCSLYADGPDPAGLRIIADFTDNEIPEPDNAANKKAICALPACLAALERAYSRACQSVRDAIKTEYSPDTISELEAERDEYKAALTLAGYIFNEPEPQ